MIRTLTLLLCAWALVGNLSAYDPLAIPGNTKIGTQDFLVSDKSREREIPIRVYLPASLKPAPVVLFSHGLGGSREMSPYLGQHWAARGYVAVFLQHPGSDTSVWQGKPLGNRMGDLKEAASPANFMHRAKDVPAVLDQLKLWNSTAGHQLSGRLDLNRVGMSGHSFGAITTQAVSGQNYPMVNTKLTDPRIQAAIAFSPSAPAKGRAEKAFVDVEIPWMLMTGTEDASPISGTSAESRLKVYPALPPGEKYELVLFGAKHSVFTEREVPGENRNPNHHRVILALSTAFWDAFLVENAEAKAWLEGNGPRSVLEPKDRWQHK